MLRRSILTVTLHARNPVFDPSIHRHNSCSSAATPPTRLFIRRRVVVVYAAPPAISEVVFVVQILFGGEEGLPFLPGGFSRGFEGGDF
jgi:hypothetical protein